MNRKKKTIDKAAIAPGIEMDELKEDAEQEEIEQGNSTPVTRLVLDRTPDD